MAEDSSWCEKCDQFMGTGKSAFHAFEIGLAIGQSDIRTDAMVFRCGYGEVYEIPTRFAGKLKTSEWGHFGPLYDTAEVRALAKKLKIKKNG